MTLEYGDQSYYPSAKVRLIIRFEEYGTTALKDKAPKVSVPKMKGVSTERSPLMAVPDPDAPTGVKRFLLQPKTGPSPNQNQPRSADNLTFEVGGIIPKRASWKQNGVHTADTLNLTLRWIDMPIDPRTIRACQVFFFLGSVKSAEFASGIRGEIRSGGGRFGASTSGDVGQPLHLVADSYIDVNDKQRSNLRFEGFVDKAKLSWSEGEPLLELECTDYTRPFLNTVRPAQAQVNGDKPIDEAIADFLSAFPAFQNMVVEYRPINVKRTDTVPLRLKNVLGTASMLPKGGPPAQGGGAVGSDQQSVWDYLVAVCGMVAHTLRIDGRLVIIQQLSDLMSSEPEAREDDPYKGRHLPSGDYKFRTFIYGRNILNLDITREFTRKQPKNIEVRSYNPARKNMIVVRYPGKGDEPLVNSGPGDGKADKEFSVVFVRGGITDEAVLKQIAKEYFFNQGKQELAVQVKTKNLATFGGDNEDLDLLDMKVGDTFEILINPADTDGTLNEVEKLIGTFDLNKKYLERLGFGPEFADAYAKARTSENFQRQYKLKEMMADWSADDGVSFTVTGVNYVVARVDRAKAEAKKNESQVDAQLQKPTTPNWTKVAEARTVAPPKKPAIPVPKGEPPKGTPAGSGLVTSQSVSPGWEVVGQNPDGSYILRRIPGPFAP